MPYDIPYLRDGDAQSHLSGYYWAAGSTADSWPGAVLQSSKDAQDYDTVDQSASRASYGFATSALPDAIRFWAWDYDTQLVIQMASGPLANATKADVLRGANMMLVGNEVIQFRRAKLISKGYYLVSHLLRGRKNTEYNAVDHEPGEVCLLITLAAMRRVSQLALTDLKPTWFKAVTFGNDPSATPASYLTLEGNDLKPASPVHLRGAKVGSDWNIKWIRRTRFGGKGLVGPTPLNEASETYSIDILDAPDGDVVRTITWSGIYDSNGNPSQLYTSAQQTTDFGSPQATIYPVIYQISGDVGRGQPLAGTLSL